MPKGYPEPLIHEQTFAGGMNSDLADEMMPHTMGRIFLNCRVVSTAGGNLGVVTNIAGNILINTPLPDGFCKTIAAAVDERNNKFYFGVYNEHGFHTWYEYDELLNSIIIILQSKTNTGDVDVFKWDLNFPIFHIDIILGNGATGDFTLLSWCDGLNKGRKFNIQKALDKSDTGYGLVITEDYITQYKKCPVYAPSLVYTTDPTRNSNFLYAQPGYKFCARFIYDDGEISNYSDWSKVIYPPTQSYQGVGAIVVENNCIEVSVETGSKLVEKIEIAMLTGILNWSTAAVLNKAQLVISSDSTYIFKFYNDGSFAAADQSKINRPYSYMFRVPTCQAFIKQALTQTGGDEGFPHVNVLVGVENQPIPLFIPDGTVNQFNNPSIDVVLQSYTVQHPFLSKSRYNPVFLFTIGADVKAGNVFVVEGYNGQTDNHYNTFKATLADTATTISARIQAWLRGFGRGDVTDHGLDGGGNASFTFALLGNYGESIEHMVGHVEPVQYETLKNDGNSVQVIKSGSIRQYAVGYEDDDGRKSQSYTTDQCAIRTPFLTEAPEGVLQQPVHVLKISHRPPKWAKYYMLYRTPDEIDFIQILVQKVIDVVVIGSASPGEYLDLVVGSLTTYQQIHPDVILKYQFTKGDRLRLIKNTNTDTYYTSPNYPVFETTVLSYNEVTTEVRNAQIVVDGTAEVIPSDGVLADYVGKNIVISGTERTIVGINGSKYVLDNIINVGGNIVTSTQPNYSFIDRRGIIRIAKPPADFTFADFSTVEVYTPQANTGNFDFKNFRDTAQKFEISNYGTDQAAHRGTDQDQDGTSDDTLSATPAIIKVTEGDAWIRNRELPTNTSLINTSVIVGSVEDPNFSDFYESNLNNLGRVYPTDDGSGQKHFGSRTRFSNKFIVDTAINGLNDFDNLDRVDNNDANGDISLTKFRELRLYIFKKLKTGWMPVGQTIINTPSGKNIIGTSDQLLGDIQYFTSDAGIGDNPESWFADESYMYFASTNTGSFVRVAGDGVDSISQEFGYDFEARTILSAVKKYKLRIYGAKDKKNGESVWSVPEYVAPIFANPINEGDWVIAETAIPGGSTPVIVSQPAHGDVTIDDDGNFAIVMDDGYLGNDTFTYKYQLPDMSYTAVKNGCITVKTTPVMSVGYRIRASSGYCEQVYGNSFRSQNFTRNNCGSGFDGSVVPYSIDANTYTATTQVGADNLAQADIDANGQAYANAHGTCTAIPTYWNVEKSGLFQKDCSGIPGTTGTYVQYIVPAHTYSSAISQADADAQAQADVDANGQAYANTNGFCVLDSLIGTLLVDYYTDYTVDLGFYCHTAGTAENDIMVTAPENNSGTGVARYPNDGRDPGACYLLSSNRLTSGSVAMRFGVNMAYFISQYPAIDHFTFIMRGRSASAQAVSGIYALRDTTEGHLIMPETFTGSGKYIPSVAGAGAPTVPPYSSNVISGADGTVGVGIGNPVLQLDYIVSTNTLTQTTY